MQNIQTRPDRQAVKANVLLITALILIVGSLVALTACSPGGAGREPGKTVISQETLEAQYGIRINLVAVTAVGGLVDIRFKFVDGAKAESLLQDSSNFPTLMVGGQTILNVPEENRPQEVRYEDDGNLFLMYPNAGNAVKPGTPVSVIFGNLQVEGITAK